MSEHSALPTRAALQRALDAASLDDLPVALQQALVETLTWLGRLDLEAAAADGVDSPQG